MSLRLLPRRRQARWILSWALDSHHIILFATSRPWLKHSSNLTKVAQMHTSLEAASLEGLKPWSSSFLRSFQCAFCDFRNLKLEFCQSPAITCCSFSRRFHPTAQNNNPTNSRKKTGSLLFLDPRAIEQCGSQLAIRRFLRTRIFGQALQRQSQWGRGLLNLSRLQCRRRGRCCGRHRRRSGRRLRAKAGCRSALGHGSNGLESEFRWMIFRKFWEKKMNFSIWCKSNKGNVRDTIFYACGFSPFTAFAP